MSSRGRLRTTTETPLCPGPPGRAEGSKVSTNKPERALALALACFSHCINSSEFYGVVKNSIKKIKKKKEKKGMLNHESIKSITVF